MAGPDVSEPLAVVAITTFDTDEYVYGALQPGLGGSFSRMQGRSY
ncbi:hypothetical protein [Paeniglutamicibacter gangotriensis]|nr:hypothetical protein [Paeniglutamicibacter gangotriensis]